MPSISQLLSSTTNRLIAVNIIVFVLLEALFAGKPSGFELYFWQSPKFEFWQLLSHLFLHGSWTHLGFNMFALWSFGRILENVWGSQRFLIFYLICGVGAGLIHLLVTQYEYQQAYQLIANAGFSASDIQRLVLDGVDISAQSTVISQTQVRDFYFLFNTPSVGASGAIYGLLAAFALLFPNFKMILMFLPVPIAAKIFVPVLLLIDLSGGLTGFSIFGQNIAHFAHIGGAIVGFLLVHFWLRKPPLPHY